MRKVVNSFDRAWRSRCASALLVVAALPAAYAQPPAPKPFRAEYDVIWKGFSAGTSTLELSAENGDRWRYLSRNQARGLFKIALPGEILQTSTFTLEKGRPQPLKYAADDGTADTSKDIALTFDRAAGRVRGIAENVAVDVAAGTDVQDPMSGQIALIQALAAGESPQRYFMIDKTEIKEFVYDAEPASRIRTALGELDTVVYASHRPGSDRITRIWLAPALGFTPVQAERRRGSKLEWSMQIRSLRR